MAIDEQTAELLSALDLTDADLAANRLGKLSPHQIEIEQMRRANLAASAHKMAGWTPDVPIFYLAILAAVVVAIYVTGAFQTLQSVLGSLTLPVLGVAAVIVAVYIAMIPVSWRRSMQRAESEAQNAPPPEAIQVLGVSGKVKTKIEHVDDDAVKLTYYYVSIEGEKISASEHQLRAFRSGGRYRVYFRRDHKRPVLVSAESLEG